MTLINCPHLLQHNLSSHHITQTLRECVSLSHPGPHVIILIFKHDDECSREDQEHVEIILNSFSDSVYEHILVLTTHHSPHTHVNDNIQEIIDKCLDRHYRLEKNSSPGDLKETLEHFVQSNGDCFLVCADSQSFTMTKQTVESESAVDASVSDFLTFSTESQRLIGLCGGRYRVLGLKEDEESKQIPDLLEYIENMKTEPYSLQMFVRAQEMRVRRETEQKYEE
ncbi:hypothetical protein E1301_Tti020414 [Triplophysa tibetana]|uniref:AIG1-type G domain-containing protein n=1 Tax=Triplophysa tibetana TaxID=1572043 RepID=A0A5A9NAG6_9TELE|nr:hypothetical protein E1301_Tti020414 [Triplophysa tibetana]